MLGPPKGDPGGGNEQGRPRPELRKFRGLKHDAAPINAIRLGYNNPLHGEWTLLRLPIARTRLQHVEHYRRPQNKRPHPRETRRRSVGILTAGFAPPASTRFNPAGERGRNSIFGRGTNCYRGRYALIPRQFITRYGLGD